MKKILTVIGLVGLMVSNSFSSDLENCDSCNDSNIKDSGFFKDVGLKIKTEDFKNLKVNLRLLSRDIKTDYFYNISSVILKTTDFKSVGIDLENDILLKDNLAFKYGIGFEYFDINIKKTEVKVYGSYISNSYDILNQKINYSTGVDIVNVLKADIKFSNIDISYRFGAYINNDIYLGYKLSEGEHGFNNTLQFEYRFNNTLHDEYRF